MEKADIEARLAVAVGAAREAGALASDLFAGRERLAVVMKGRQDRVTEADRRVEETILARIGAAFPEDAILGEESGLVREKAGAGSLWVVDPIDGTDAFVFGLPMWSISIAWMHDGEVKVGVVYDPVHDEMFVASLGAGATLNGAGIHASTADDVGSGLVGIGHSLRVEPSETLSALERLMEQGGLFHRCGSGALSLAWVAAGRLLGYYEAHINSWDCLAGLLLVTEAGGWHSDFLAGDGLTRGNPLIASGPNLVGALSAVAGVR